MAKKEHKQIDSKKDYILSQMAFVAHGALTNLCSYMQERTPYGDVYEKAFEQYKKLMKEFKKFEEALADTVDLRWDREVGEGLKK